MGLIVGPFLILYYVITFLCTRYAWRAYHTPRKRIMAASLTLLDFIFLFTGDAIIGRVALYGLCATKGGVTVNQSVELGKEYFDDEGKLRFLTKKFY